MIATLIVVFVALLVGLVASLWMSTDEEMLNGELSSDALI